MVQKLNILMHHANPPAHNRDIVTVQTAHIGTKQPHMSCGRQ